MPKLARASFAPAGVKGALFTKKRLDPGPIYNLSFLKDANYSWILTRN
jgi:hypothetical protein